MKFIKSLITCITISTFIACSSTTASNDENTMNDSTNVADPSAEDYSKMTEVSLDEYGIMASIMTPKEEKARVEIEETSWGSVTLIAGDKFGLEIVPFGLSLEEMKAEMDQGGVYEIEIVEENSDYVLYKRSIPNSEVKAEYHFFMNKEINGELYEIKSMADMELKEAHVRNILKSAKSFRSKEAV